MTIRPTPRAVAWLGAGLPLALLLGAAAPAAWALGIVYGAAIMLAIAIDALLGLRRRDLAVVVTAPDSLEIGRIGTLRARLAPGRRHRPAACAARLDLDSPLGPAPTVAGRLSGESALDLFFPLKPERRGQGLVRALTLRWQGPLGLSERQASLPLERRIAILPNIQALRAGALRFFTSDAMLGQKAQQRAGEGAEFDSLKDFAAGQDKRRIDWKHSARHRRLLAKECRAERNHSVILAFDSGHLMREPLAAPPPGGDAEGSGAATAGAAAGMPKLDHLLGAGLHLARAALQSGDRVGLYAFDAQPRLYVAPQAGAGAFRRLHHLASGIDYRAEETNFTLGLASLLQRLERRSLIVLMSDFVDTLTAELMVENVQRLARRHLLLFVSPTDPALAALTVRPARRLGDAARAIVADDMSRERRIVFERLRRLGVLVIEAAPAAIGPALVNRYLEIKRQDLL